MFLIVSVFMVKLLVISIRLVFPLLFILRHVRVVSFDDFDLTDPVKVLGAGYTVIFLS